MCSLFFERFVLFFCLKIERFVPDSAEIWICGLYIRTKSSDEEKEISSKSIVQRKILFYPGKIFKDTLADMSITRRAEIETDYTDGSSNGGNTGGKPGSGDDGKGEGGVTPDPAV